MTNFMMKMENIMLYRMYEICEMYFVWFVCFINDLCLCVVVVVVCMFSLVLLFIEAS